MPPTFCVIKRNCNRKILEKVQGIIGLKKILIPAHTYTYYIILYYIITMILVLNCINRAEYLSETLRNN